MDDGGPALFRLVRFWSRRWARGVAADVGPGVSLPQHVLVVDAVDALARAGEEATVGALAGLLGLDRSGASRMISASAAAGYLDRHPPATDARRSPAALTPAGRALLDRSRDWQRARFAELTAGWSDDDRTTFARLLDRLAREVGA